MKGKSSNTLFAVIGLACGLANALRLPTMCAKYGFCFVVIYCICLFAFGLPLFYAELVCGLNKVKIPFLSALMLAAKVNSALIALYYGGNAIKLATASLEWFLFEKVRYLPYIMGVITVLTCVLALLAMVKGWFLSGKTGKVSVCAFLILFVIFAICGGVWLFRNGARWGSVANVSAWREGIAQVLLSLSLAGGVTPSLAKKVKGNLLRVAFLCVLVNACGCLLVAVGLAPYLQVGGGVNLFIAAVGSLGGVAKRLVGFLVFAFLSAIAFHGQCALFYPLIDCCKSKFKFAPFAFALLTLILSPLFLAEGGQVISCCDVVCCCVVAPLVALLECLTFCFALNFGKPMRFWLLAVCLPCSVITLFTSACGANFGGYGYAATAVGVCYAVLPPLAFLVKFLRVKAKNSLKNFDCKI